MIGWLADDLDIRLRCMKINDKQLEFATFFKYVWAKMLDKGSKHEVLAHIAKATSAMDRLKPIQTDKKMTLKIEIRLMLSLVISTLLYAFRKLGINCWNGIKDPSF